MREGEDGMATTGPSTGSGTGREIPGQAGNEEGRPGMRKRFPVKPGMTQMNAGNDDKEIPGQARNEAKKARNDG